MANGSATSDITGESKKSSTVLPKSPAKASAKKDSPKKTAKVEQSKKTEPEATKAEKKVEATKQRVKETKPADYDEGTKH